ncbi:hypothetical protein D1007_31474 [Hordeum vulgare]|nr:hypothetical protein D1007_31474 [Hordeum vulgare]
MAGMTLSSRINAFSLRRSSNRLKSKTNGMPIAKMAKKMLCRRLGILNEGDHITEEAILKFTALFRGRLPSIAVDALTALFRLDNDLATVVEDTLIAHEGGDAVGHSTTMADGVVGCNT